MGARILCLDVDDDVIRKVSIFEQIVMHLVLMLTTILAHTTELFCALLRAGNADIFVELL